MSAADSEERAAIRGSAWASGARAQWSQRALDGLRGVAVLAGSTDFRVQVSAFSPGDSRADLLIIVAAAAATVARRFPVPALMVASVLDAVPYWLPISGAGYHLSFMICLYMVASRCARRTAVVVVTVAYAAQVGLMAYERDWQFGDFFVLFVAMSNLVAIALGIAARSGRATVRALQARAEEAERSRDSEARKRVAEDRLRVARDLHDSVAHQIAVMNLNTTVASVALPDRPEDAQQALAIVHEAGRSVLASIGDLLTGLREESGDDLEPSYDLDELRVLVEEFRILMPTIRSDLSSLPEDGAPAVDAVTYLVVREGLTNAYKHGDHDSPVEVEVRLGVTADSVWLHNTTRDATSGFIEGFGLRGMRERVAAVEGQLRVSASEGSFTVAAVVPHGEVGR